MPKKALPPAVLTELGSGPVHHRRGRDDLVRRAAGNVSRRDPDPTGGEGDVHAGRRDRVGLGRDERDICMRLITIGNPQTEWQTPGRSRVTTSAPAMIDLRVTEWDAARPRRRTEQRLREPRRAVDQALYGENRRVAVGTTDVETSPRHPPRPGAARVRRKHVLVRGGGDSGGRSHEGPVAAVAEGGRPGREVLASITGATHAGRPTSKFVYWVEPVTGWCGSSGSPTSTTT